jgi:hypothetical protein
MVACECSGVILADYSKGKLTSIFGDGGNTDGAEGQNRTGYAGLFRAALYR